jgi:hypothetical protein
MSSSLTFEGLTELRQALVNLPAELTSEASAIVYASASEAARAIIDAYPTRTGHLKDGVSVTRTRVSTFGTAAVVTNRAPHAFIFEMGTQARHTSLGANRGSMPPGRVFVPRVQRYRARMYEGLAEMIRTHGLEVTTGGGEE